MYAKYNKLFRAGKLALAAKQLERTLDEAHKVFPPHSLVRAHLLRMLAFLESGLQREPSGEELLDHPAQGEVMQRFEAALVELQPRVDQFGGDEFDIFSLRPEESRWVDPEHEHDTWRMELGLESYLFVVWFLQSKKNNAFDQSHCDTFHLEHWMVDAILLAPSLIGVHLSNGYSFRWRSPEGLWEHISLVPEADIWALQNYILEGAFKLALRSSGLTGEHREALLAALPADIRHLYTTASCTASFDPRLSVLADRVGELNMLRERVDQVGCLDEIGGRLDRRTNTHQANVADRIKSRGINVCWWPDCSATEKHPSEFQRCGGCKEACYCTREHQRLHWKSHKGDCSTTKCNSTATKM